MLERTVSACCLGSIGPIMVYFGLVIGYKQFGCSLGYLQTIPEKPDFQPKSWASTLKPQNGDFDGSSLLAFLKAIVFKFYMRTPLGLKSVPVKIQRFIL